jgi:hypothetical protein
MVTLELDPKAMRDLHKKIEHLANVDKEKRTEIRKAAQDAAKIYVDAARSNIQDYSETITVIRKNGTRVVIPPGTLRRSIGTWVPYGAKSHVAAGPRASISKKLPEDRDGWFAHFVEYGTRPARFGGNRTTRNTGVFARTKQQVGERIARQMTEAMQAIINGVTR